MVNKTKEKYGVDDNVSFNTIKSRFQRKSIICNHRGIESPMAVVEPAILEISIQRGKMNQLLTVAKGLLLANSLIKPGSNNAQTLCRKKLQVIPIIINNYWQLLQRFFFKINTKKIISKYFSGLICMYVLQYFSKSH